MFNYSMIIEEENSTCSMDGNWDLFENYSKEDKFIKYGNGCGYEDGRGYGCGIEIIDKNNTPGLAYGCGIEMIENDKLGSGHGFGYIIGRGNEFGCGG